MDDCYICGLYVQGEIDALIQKSEVDELLDDRTLDVLTSRINDMLERIYGPAVQKVDPGTVRVHAMRHPLYTSEGQVVVHEDTQMVRIDDKFLPIPTLKQAIVSLLALGLENIRLHPELVSVTHTLRLLELAGKYGMHLGQDELEDVLQRKIAQPTVAPTNGYNPLVPPDANNDE